MKKDVLFITVADEKNIAYAKALEQSFRKFHKDIDFIILTGDELKAELDIDDKFFYRATPILGEKYLNEYELVVKIDADSIVCGDLSYIWQTKDYDVGTVLNWNRSDPIKYGLVQFQGVLPVEYMNCGLVAMRNPKFVHEWKNLCFTPQFARLQFREQDLLNALIYYGNWNIRCFDHLDKLGGNHSWWGLISKGEWVRAELRGDEIICPQGLGDTPFPPEDITIKILHAGGGNIPNKMNYHTWFNEAIAKRLDYLTSEEK
jgi:hypothetical protein